MKTTDRAEAVATLSGRLKYTLVTRVIHVFCFPENKVNTLFIYIAKVCRDTLVTRVFHVFYFL